MKPDEVLTGEQHREEVEEQVDGKVARPETRHIFRTTQHAACSKPTFRQNRGQTTICCYQYMTGRTPITFCWWRALLSVSFAIATAAGDEQLPQDVSTKQAKEMMNEIRVR
jgi:hypothetical protein